MKSSLPRKYAAALTGMALIGVAYGFSRPPSLAPAERQQLAARFHFESQELPAAPEVPLKEVREVHPSLQRIAAWISSLGAAVTLADLDGDGLSNDLVLVDPRTDAVQVMPVPGTAARYETFTLSPGSLPFDSATMAPMGTLAGDFNEDGLTDVLIYYWGRAPVLLLRRSTGSIRDDRRAPLSASAYVPKELIPAQERWFSNAAAQADLDGDGHLDLIIGNYFQDGARILDAQAGGVEVMHEGKAKALNGGRKHLFLWESSERGSVPAVTYAEQTGVFPEEIARGWTLAAGAADLDGDRLPELYFGNDFGPDRLLHNRSTPGHLQFVELVGRRDLTTPKSCVLGHDSFKGMGVDFGDVNGDGLLDIYVSNIATTFGLTESHFLWESTGRLEEMKDGIAPYVQGSEPLGLSRSGWGWDCRLVDFDNDGGLEAIQAVGFIKGAVNRWPELQALGTSNSGIVHNPRFWPSFRPGADLSGHDTMPFFVRAADGRYFDVAAELGLDKPTVGRGIAVGDVDGDGRLDFVMANQWEPSRYYHNEAPAPGAFLGLHLLVPIADDPGAPTRAWPGHALPDRPARPAIGAAVAIRLADGRKRVAQVNGGTGHSGRCSPDVHLGLGPAAPDQPVAVELRWRDAHGAVQETVLQLKPGWHTVLLGDGKSVAVQEPP